MNLHPKERKQKHYIALQKEFNHRSRMKWNATSVPLKKPIRYGWKKFFSLRADISNRPDASSIRLALSYINNTVYSRNADFHYRARKQTKVKNPSLRSLSVKEWEDLPSQCKKYFVRCTPGLCNDCHKQKIKSEPRYHWRNIYWFVYKVEPHYLTHYREVDSENESRLNKIMNQLDRGGWAVLSKIKGRRYRWEPGYDDSIIFLRQKIAEDEMIRELNATKFNLY